MRTASLGIIPRPFPPTLPIMPCDYPAVTRRSPSIRIAAAAFIPLSIVFHLAAICGPSIGAEIDFNRDVRPILSDRCFKCHGPDASNQESEFRVDSRENAIADLGGYFGIVPGDLAASELHLRIHDADDPMPPEEDLKKLTDRDKEILDQWIIEGATFDSHWAFKSLPESVSVPEAGKGWALGPIDQFIARAFEAKGMSHASEASKEKWLRRATFDLTGLPPPIEEIDSFLNDDSAGSYERVVNRLLESVACAERLTSEWLDVARYADTNGYQRDDERFVWPYRDWVTRAFRDGMPYDQFVELQLAGDLLPNATIEQRLATTFNRLHSHKKEGGVAVEEFRVENVADRVHTVASAFLGLTMECTRCHDHKYDPLTMTDYYSLSAFFDNIDENGLISFFTDAVPTPAMSLVDDDQQSAIDEAKNQVAKLEASYRSYLANEVETGYQEWLRDREANGIELSRGLIVDLPLDEFAEATEEEAKDEGGKKVKPERMRALENLVGARAISPVANKIVDGRVGGAIELTGDDAVVMPETGHFARHDPFSVSLWIWAPDTEKRAVIYRRSRGWDDAGSVGYELTKEGDVLSAKMCHFWPGDAIAIETAEPIEANRWYHVVVTYDGSSRAQGLRMFLDGEQAKTNVIQDHLTRNVTKWRGGYPDLAIGSRYRDRGFAGGRVDAFKVYDRQVSGLEVRQLHDDASLEELVSKQSEDLTAGDHALLREHFVLAIDESSQAMRKSTRDARVVLNDAVDATPAIMVMREEETPRETYVLTRGVYDQRAEQVEPKTPQFLPPMREDLPKNRLGLARWLTDPSHPLTARVAVNRYWQMMFGNGLVQTPEDFGNQGENPTHPELLDWLSRDFVANGWDVHRLLKQIALSATYRQSSIASAEARNLDPQNRMLTRGTTTRLSAEMIRDNVLATSGLLVDQLGGPPVKPYDVALAYTPLKVDKGDKLYRRSLYTYWKRTSPAPVMMTLNTPTREVCRLKREVTSTPLQALVMLNGPQFIEASRALAARLLQEHGDDLESMIGEAFQLLTSRSATAREQEILSQLYQEQLDYFQTQPDRVEPFLGVGEFKVEADLSEPALAAATVLINSIMNLDECVRHQ